MSTYQGDWDRSAHPKPSKAQRPCCVACGRPFPKPKPVSGPIDTATMTDAQLFAHYKRTAIAEDLKFFLRLTLSPELRTRAEAVKTPTAKDIALLRTAWRTERQTSDAMKGIPSIGSVRWTEYYQILKDADADAQAIVDAEAEGMAS